MPRAEQRQDELASGGLASGAGRLGENWVAGKESSAPPFIGSGWGCGRACTAERGAVLDDAGDKAGQRSARALIFGGAVATRARCY